MLYGNILDVSYHSYVIEDSFIYLFMGLTQFLRFDLTPRYDFGTHKLHDEKFDNLMPALKSGRKTIPGKYKLRCVISNEYCLMGCHR